MSDLTSGMFRFEFVVWEGKKDTNHADFSHKSKFSDMLLLSSEGPF